MVRGNRRLVAQNAFRKIRRIRGIDWVSADGAPLESNL